MPRTLRNARGSNKKKPKQAKRRKQKLPTESTAAMIDRLLLSPVKITQNGQQEQVPALAAIMRQLLQKEIEGNTRASAVLRKYKTLIRRSAENRPLVVFAENDYSRSFPSLEPGGCHG